MSNITFVYSDFENLGVEYLMAVCEKEGYNVKIVIYYADDPYTGVKKKLNYKDIAKKIVRTNPYVVIFSCITDNFRHQINCAEELKKIKPEIYTIFGGIHVTAVPHRVIKHACIDAISIGEGEISIPQFLNSLFKSNRFQLPSEKIKGILFKKDGRIIGDCESGDLADLNQIPLPAKEKFYAAMGYVPKEYYIITGRGCPYRCSYCYNSIRDKKYFRRRSVANVIGELKWAKERFRIKYIHFCDDSFTSGKDWLREFSGYYKREINLPFLCSANPMLIDEEIVGLLKEAGCVDVQVGVQSLSKEICENVLLRKSDNKKVAEAVRLIKKAGMMVQVDHILGIPEDTLDNQEEALLFYNELRPTLVSVFWLTYYPGTEIINLAREKGLLKEEDINRLEEGYKLTEGNLHSGGSLSNPEQYYGVALLYNYLFLLPKVIINFLIKTKCYKKIKVKSYFFSTALPRFILSVVDNRYFTGRGYIERFIRNMYKS